MQYPRIRSAKAINNHVLLIEFENHERRKYDITPLLEKEMFYPLKDSVLFKNVQIEKGGYAVYWNDEIDISEHELWVHGTPIP
ncbi:hypothetical protein Nhal_2525 [Nitrosococcus halophilus Nc 4]|uniref:DUF2442 domain-containing protein n=1 Tax=Nitrosococcus halophilus (strain Nc4) TaxID=472759 RepID=D5BWF1_NITHN|nr:DUF2442 domain-containing protein [Nitrosococcus halophilus]ADE15608.1 hypothetical protein Nhal_2525 [Nitrosococcus halophilus Nc 4]